MKLNWSFRGEDGKALAFYFVAVAWYLLLPVLLLPFPVSRPVYLYWSTFSLLFLVMAVGLVFPKTFFVIQVVLGLLSLVCFHIAITWHVGCDIFSLAGLFGAALESPFREEGEYIREFILRSPFSYVLLGYFVGGLFLSGKAIKEKFSVSLKSAFQIFALGVTLVSLPILSSTWRYSSPPPLLVIQGVSRAIETKIDLSRRAASWHLQDVTCNSPYQKIVVILGESANRDFMSLYGYSRETTPFLDSLANKPGVVFFKVKAISGGDQTNFGIPLLLTDATAANFDSFYTSPGLPSLLGACGYQTFWFSAQEKFNFYVTSVAAIASEASETIFLPEITSKHVYDENLLSLLTPERVKPGVRQAYFLHLMGSHFIYTERYPPSHALNPHPTNLIDSYINTIYYTDWVISQITTRFQKLAPNDTILFAYVSDHGEYLTPKVVGHGTKHQDDYRVPFVLWSNHPSNILSLKKLANPDRIINTECFYHVIRYLAGIDSTLTISYSPQVIHLFSDNVLNYNDLPSAHSHEHVP